MVFCFLLGSCIRSALEVVLVLIRLALEERAILAVPSTTGVVRDYLEVCMLVQMMLQD